MNALNKYGLEFHHLGLAVKHPQEAAAMLKGLGYKIGDTVRDDLQNVHLALCTRRGMPAIEIIYATETPGPVSGILKANASMIYHICYTSKDLEKSLDAMERDNNRVVLISAPKPAPLFGGRKVSFHLVHGFGMIEILEDDQPRSRSGGKKSHEKVVIS